MWSLNNIKSIFFVLAKLICDAILILLSYKIKSGGHKVLKINIYDEK